MTDNATYLSQLHHLLNQHFNLAEIRTLCLDLNVDYESVAGEEKPSRIRELLLGLGRNGRLPELVTLIQRQRPLVEWPTVPDEFELPESLETAVSPDQYHIYGDNIQGDKFTGDKIGRDKIVVGDVSGQSAVAVGERAQATINRYGDIIIRADNFEDLPPAPGKSPYKGLAYFSTKDKVIFFGREKLSDELADRLQTTSFLAIMGASGSGKSSLLRAGIIPRLEERNWRIHIIKPGVHPLAALAASLTRDELDPATANTIGNALATNANTLHQTAEKLVARIHAERLLLAVDQFEELFTQCKDPQEQQAFVDNLVSAAQAQGAVTVLLSMRADFYGRVSQFHNLPDLISQEQVYIKPMAEEDLVRAIAEPAKRGGWQFVEGLVEQFVADVGNEPGRLPLLSHALLATWERRRGVVMTLGGYREAGGVKSAIAQTAEATYASLTASEQLIAKRIFLRLTELGKGTEDTRRRVNQVELGEDTAVQAVTQRLTAARLITTTQDGIDVAHEALIREWPRLREWLDADREGLIIHRRLTDAEREWRHNGQEPSLLYSGFRLNETEQWVKDNTNALNDLEQTFFTASIAERQKREEEEETQRLRELKQAQALAAEQQQRAEEAEARQKAERERAEAQTRETEEQKRRVKVTRWGLGIVALLLATAIGTALFGFFQANIANTRASIVQSNFLANEAQNLGNDQGIRALLLAIEAGKYDPTTTSAYTALQELLPFIPELHYTLHHDGEVTAATWNKDESLILTSSSDSTAKIWDANNGELIHTLQHDGIVYEAKWNEDESIILTNGGEIIFTSLDDTSRSIGEAKVWDATTGQLLHTLNHDQPVNQAKWNADESLILTTSLDGTAKVWDADTGRLRHTFNHDGMVHEAMWNADESFILTSSSDATVKVWNADTGQLVHTLSHDGFTDEAKWNRGGSLILTRDGDTAKVWDATSGQLLHTLKHNEGVKETRWNGNETLILTSSVDGTAKVWDANTGQLQYSLNHGVNVNGAKWSEDESLILTYGFGDTAKVWDANTGQLINTFSHDGAVNEAIWNGDESLILTSSQDGTAKVWNTITGQLIYTLSHDGPVREGKWNRDGSFLLTRSHDGTTKVWNLISNQMLQTLSHDGGINEAKWNWDESLILTSGDDSTAKIWDAITGQLIHTLDHDASVLEAEWNENNSLILTCSSNGTAKVWDANTGQFLHEFGYDGEENQVRCNGDKSLIFTISKGEVKLWDAVTGQLLHALDHNEDISEVEWNENESLILTISGSLFGNSGEVNVWDANTGQLLHTLTHHVYVNEVKWNQDESRILTIGYADLGITGEVNVWNADTGHRLLTLYFDGSIDEAKWNGDESLILTISDDAVKIWDANTAQLQNTLSHDASVGQAKWNENESLILTTSFNGTTKVWDANTGQIVHTLSHDEFVYEAKWNGDESLILTNSFDGTAKVWDANTGDLLHLMSGESAAIIAKWNQDESRILLATEDGLLRIYFTQMDELINYACDRVSRNLTLSEWQRYFPYESYRQTCENLPIHPSVQKEALE